MFPSDKRLRPYVSGASKRHDKKCKLEGAVASAPTMEKYFAANTATSVVLQSDEEQKSADVAVQPGNSNNNAAIVYAADEPLDKHNTTTTTATSDMTSTDHELLCLDMTAEYLSDRAHFPSRLSNELRDQILNYGHCHSKRSFPVSEEFGWRTFSENHYRVKSGTSRIKIQRL